MQNPLARRIISHSRPVNGHGDARPSLALALPLNWRLQVGCEVKIGVLLSLGTLWRAGDRTAGSTACRDLDNRPRRDIGGRHFRER